MERIFLITLLQSDVVGIRMAIGKLDFHWLEVDCFHASALCTLN